MPSDAEKARRKEVLRDQREQARIMFRDSLPASPSKLKALFDYLDASLTSQTCNHTLRFVNQFIDEYRLLRAPVIAWLQNYGGHCDCEVLANVEPIVQDAIPNYGNLNIESAK